MPDTHPMSEIRIKFDPDNPNTEAIIEIDDKTYTQHHVNPASEYTQEEFAVIALCRALGFDPAECLSFDD